MKIAVIAPMEPASFFDVLWQGAWEATFDISPFGVEVRNLTTQSSDLAGQRRILTELRAEPVQAIALVPAHSSGLDDLIDEHVGGGTPVITFHTDAPDSRRTLFVGADGLQAGRLAGEVLGKLTGGRGRLLLFQGPLEEHHVAQRYHGLQLELRNHQGEVVEAVWPSCRQPRESLAQARAVEGIYVGSDQLADVAQAMEDLGVRVPCVGFTNSEEAQAFLNRRTISAIIDESRYQQGYFAIQKAYEAASRGAGMDSVHIPCTVVFASNMQAEGVGQSLNAAFEALVIQRTESLRGYQKMLEEANAKLESLATTDALTGLFNRRKFQELLEREVAHARRHGPLSLLMIDLNLFKAVNDRYGHQAGDDALKLVAEVLRSRCRASDSTARLGGDEFAVILPHTDHQGSLALRDSIHAHIAEVRLDAGGEKLPLSLSIGIATLSGESVTVQELMALADQDMYRVKAASRKDARSVA